MRFTAADVLDTLHTFKCDEHPWDHHNSALFTLLVAKGLLFVANYYIQIDHFIIKLESLLLSVATGPNEIFFKFLDFSPLKTRPCKDVCDWTV